MNHLKAWPIGQAFFRIIKTEMHTSKVYWLKKEVKID